MFPRYMYRSCAACKVHAQNHRTLQDVANQQMLDCSSSKLQFMPAVDGRGYPIKTTCVVEEVGLVAVFEGLQNPQPGKPT